MDWSERVVPALRALAPYRPGMTEEQLRRDTGRERILKFSSNESPLGPSPTMLAAMQAALAQSHRYPDTQALRDRLAQHLGVPADRLVLGNGSIDVIASLVRAVAGPQHNVVLSDHGYCAYPPLAKEQGATIRLAPSGPGFGHDVDALLARIDLRTRLLLVDSPTNLSGRALRADQLDCLVRGLPPYVLLVLDEAYAEFARDEDPPCRTAQLPLQHPNVVVTRTFSKAYGLAGLRIGYAVADAGLAECLHRVRPPFPVSRVALAGAAAALDEPQHMQRIVRCARAGRETLSTALRALGVQVVEGQANFVLADFGGAAGTLHQGLLARGFITRPMHAYGLPTHIRISIGTPEEVAQLVDVLQALLQRSPMQPLTEASA